MKQESKLVTLSAVSVKSAGNDILSNINLDIFQHEQWAIVGASGSGKTTLAHVLTNKIFYNGQLEYYFPEPSQSLIELVEQQHHFKNLSNTHSFYYQQRFNSADAEDSLTVKEMLGTTPGNERWIDLLHLAPLLEKPVIQLSNGENKRLQLAKALQANPLLLVLDNPFTGLDAEGRKTLHAVMNSITLKGIHIILITPPGELPENITHVAVLEKGQLIFADKKENYQPLLSDTQKKRLLLNAEQLEHLQQEQDGDFTIAVKMENVNIRYGEKIILQNIQWEVKKGECWSISGPNGAGKSTLLSLITADNPQAYANKIILFDTQRGSGESIWEIKKKIGFVSPELHLYFEQSASCFEVIASGLFDTIGLFRRISEKQEQQVYLWMQLLELESIKNKRIGQLSAGQQRMALLARALVKNPPMLILDEPCQGLDDLQAGYFKQLINEICNTFNTTLIYVSHYRKDIPECIQHFLELNNGSVSK